MSSLGEGEALLIFKMKTTFLIQAAYFTFQSLASQP